MASDSGVQSECTNVLNNLEKYQCWGDTSSDDCSIKSTAIAILALKTVGQNVDLPLQWLLNQKQLSTGITWYLEIDSLKAFSKCSGYISLFNILIFFIYIFLAILL